MPQSLYVRDGNGDLRQIEVISGSSASIIIPVHSLTGSVATTLSNSDLATLTGSVLAVSSAVGLFNQQLYQALTGGPVSMSVDIVAGDVNAITGAIDMTTAEVAKLTALSASQGLKVYTLETASVNLVNTGSLTASISNFPATQSVSFSTGSVLTASVQAEYSTLVSSGSASYNEFSTITEVHNATAKTLTISNQMNGALYIKLDSSTTTATNSDYTYVLNATETYEAMQQNVRLHHGLSGSATSGRVRWTYTY
jgi:hypothetical protein